MAARTLYDKLWDSHVVRKQDSDTYLLYIDRHLVHEVTSPQAFEGLRLAGRKIWRQDSNLATADHNIPTTNRSAGITDSVARLQVETLNSNCKDFGITEFSMDDIRQGIVHVIGPEQGATLPGMTLVCGDSHTSTHGALGALAFGIGTSEVERVLATQCLLLRKSKNMLVNVNGQVSPGITGKDIILAIIGQIGTAGGTGYTIEFAGEAISALSIEARMTVCNMAIEAGARAGLIAVDQKTIDYVKGRPFAPKDDQWQQAVSYWQTLRSDPNARFDRVVDIVASRIKPLVTWGTSPEMVVDIDYVVPNPKDQTDAVKREGMEAALRYMDLKPDVAIQDIPIDKVFIGSCTNSRIEDLRAAAAVIKGRQIAASVTLAMVAGFEWRDPGCSMCLAMNADRLEPGERCASTSNRNFEGRQGQGGRTHLVSPAMAAAAAIAGHFVDVRRE